MKKYLNNNFKFELPEIIGLSFFLFFLCAAGFFCKSYNDVRELFNIEKTEVDYIIQFPSKEQVNEINSLNFIDKIVPYYFRSVTISSENGNIDTSLFIIENDSDIRYTPFSDKLMVKKDNSVLSNRLLITDDFAETANFKIGDSIEIMIDGTKVTFIVSGIFKNDYRNVGGSLLAIDSGDVADALLDRMYSGAYVSGNNLTEANSYFIEEYYPMGDIRTREEFSSDEAYQIYLDTRNDSDSTKDAFITAEYIRELTKRNEGKLARNIALTAACVLVAYLIMVLLISARASSYTRLNVLRDIKDNFTIEQEVDMYRRYFCTAGLLMLCVNIIVAVAELKLGWLSITSIINIVCVCLTVILVTLSGYIAIKKLKQQFLVESEKYEEEQKRVEEQ